VCSHLWFGKVAAQSTIPPKQEKTGFFTVSTADVVRTLLVTGELRALRSRDILVPDVRRSFGAAITFLVPEGSHVKQGQRILEFDTSSTLSQKAEAERKLDEAKLKIEKTKADVEAQRCDLLNELVLAEGNLKVAELYGKISRELLPANQYQKYQLDLEKARLALSKAQERLANHEESIPAQLALVELEREQAEIELKKIDADLALLEVDAPQDGIVIYGDNWANNRKVQVGDTLFQRMTVLTLPDLSSLQVIGYVYDTELRFLSPGMTCEFSLDAVPGKVWRGKIASLTSVATRKGFASQHKVFRAVIEPEALDLAVMKPGMTVRVELPLALASHAIAIPRELLGVDLQGQYYVRKGTDPRTAAIQPVKVGVFSDRLVQIVEGLKAGETIVSVHREGSL
jgi:multidrug efflux pump subunit AcrA (membrane-fusion protein)